MKENKIFIIIGILIFIQIFCYISRKIYSPNYLNNLHIFDSSSYYNSSYIILFKDNFTDDFDMQNYQHSRIFINTEYNKIKLYISLSKGNYYYDKMIKFDLVLPTNESNYLIGENNTLYYNNDLNYTINFKKMQESIFTKTKKNSLQYVSLMIDNNQSDLLFYSEFDEFIIVLDLHKEKVTYRAYYLAGIFLNTFILIIIDIFYLGFDGELIYYLQGISIIFLQIIRVKVFIMIIYDIYYFFIVGLPIFRLLFLYSHFLNYGEILVSLNDLISCIFFGLEGFFVCGFIIIIHDNDKRYYYYYHNKLNNKTVIPSKYDFKFFPFSLRLFIIFTLITLAEFSNSILIQFIPLYIGIFIAILKHLLQREVINNRYKGFIYAFYIIGILSYSIYLFSYNIINFYKNKFFYAMVYYSIVFLLSFILIYIIMNEIKFRFTMKKDFEKLKYLKNDCCSICLQDFDLNHNNFIFCKITELDNIYRTKCNHYYHEICLFDWRKHREICPICKSKLSKPDYIYFYNYTPCEFD